jgi:hypothetical protein
VASSIIVCEVSALSGSALLPQWTAPTKANTPAAETHRFFDPSMPLQPGKNMANSCGSLIVSKKPAHALTAKHRPTEARREEQGLPDP